MANTGNVTVTERDMNPFSPTYNETRTSTYQDYVKCIPDGLKLYWEKSDSTTGSVDCNSDTVLEDTEMPSNSDEIVRASIGNCVTKIDISTFKDCTSLTSVNIADTVIEIQDSAFSGCTALPSVTIPDGVSTFGQTIFGDCTSLTSVNIPTSLSTISNSDFKNCTALPSITIPGNVQYISDSAFRGCTNLSSVTFNSGQKSIGASSFRDCTSLTVVTIPDTVTGLGYKVFGGCTSLTTVNFNAVECNDCQQNNPPFYQSGVTTINVGNGVLRMPQYFAYYLTTLENLNLSDTVTYIGASAFSGCIGLTSVVLPSSVTYIGNSAFRYCSNLTSIYLYATTPPTLASYAFDETNDCTIYVPSESVDTYKSSWSGFSSRIQAIP